MSMFLFVVLASAMSYVSDSSTKVPVVVGHKLSFATATYDTDVILQARVKNPGEAKPGGPMEYMVIGVTINPTHFLKGSKIGVASLMYFDRQNAVDGLKIKFLKANVEYIFFLRTRDWPFMTANLVIESNSKNVEAVKNFLTGKAEQGAAANP